MLQIAAPTPLGDVGAGRGDPVGRGVDNGDGASPEHVPAPVGHGGDDPLAGQGALDEHDPAVGIAGDGGASVGQRRRPQVQRGLDVLGEHGDRA
jgi:hypothetical protein